MASLNGCDAIRRSERSTTVILIPYCYDLVKSVSVDETITVHDSLPCHARGEGISTFVQGPEKLSWSRIPRQRYQCFPMQSGLPILGPTSSESVAGLDQQLALSGKVQTKNRRTVGGGSDCGAALPRNCLHEHIDL
jgi:hypothetical protein